MAETTYVVLREATSALLGENGVNGWVHTDTVPATSPETAIRVAAARAEDPSGKWVAAPARSWKPVTVEATTQKVLKLS